MSIKSFFKRNTVPLLALGSVYALTEFVLPGFSVDFVPGIKDCIDHAVEFVKNPTVTYLSDNLGETVSTLAYTYSTASLFAKKFLKIPDHPVARATAFLGGAFLVSDVVLPGLGFDFVPGITDCIDNLVDIVHNPSISHTANNLGKIVATLGYVYGTVATAIEKKVNIPKPVLNLSYAALSLLMLQAGHDALASNFELIDKIPSLDETYEDIVNIIKNFNNFNTKKIIGTTISALAYTSAGLFAGLKKLNPFGKISNYQGRVRTAVVTGTLITMFLALSIPKAIGYVKAEPSNNNESSHVQKNKYIAPFFTPSVHYWGDLIKEYADIFSLDPNLVATVIQIESCGYARATSPAAAKGLMQVMSYHFAKGEDPYHPSTNMNRGTAYLKNVHISFGGNIELTFGGYNGGITGAKRPQSQWSAEALRYVTYGVPIYKDARDGKSTSAKLNEWIALYGNGLCAQALASQQ